jgi:hypothetical protein
MPSLEDTPENLSEEEEEMDLEEKREQIEREAQEIREDEDSFEDELPEQEPGTVSGPGFRDEKPEDPVEELLR